MLFYELSIIMILQFISSQSNFSDQSVILSNMLFSAKKNLFFPRFFKYWTFLHSLPLILKNNYPPFIQNSSRNDSQWMKPLKPFSKHWWSFFKLKNYHSRKIPFLLKYTHFFLRRNTLSILYVLFFIASLTPTSKQLLTHML